MRRFGGYSNYKISRREIGGFVIGGNMRKITDEYEEFRNAKGIDVYYNDITGYFTVLETTTSFTNFMTAILGILP